MVTIDPLGSGSKVARLMEGRSDNDRFLELHLNCSRRMVRETCEG